MMTTSRRPTRACPQGRRARGWTLVETSVSMALLALTAVAANDLMGRSTALAGDEHSQDRISKASDALTGWAYTKFALPRPSLSVPAPWATGYLQGTLPADRLGLELDGPLIYTVPSSFTSVAKTPQWPADPLGWLSTGLAGFSPRKTVNGMDLCRTLIDAERSGPRWTDQRQVAFGVQEYPAATGSGGDPPFTPPALASTMASINGQNVLTRLTGPVELANDLGCVDRALALAVAAKSASVASDTVGLSQRTEQFLEAEKSLSENVTKVSAWRTTNDALYMAFSTLKSLDLAIYSNRGDPSASTGITDVYVTAASLEVVAEVARIAVYSAALAKALTANAEWTKLTGAYQSEASKMTKAATDVLNSQVGRLRELDEKGIRP